MPRPLRSRFILAAFATAIMLGGHAFGAEPRSNILMIAVDDLNDWIGPLKGHPQAKTPNMDRLAARGVAFTNAHCAVPYCNPSRTALLFGQSARRTGLYDNQQSWQNSPAFSGLESLPKAFKARGYFTATTGKIFHANHSGARDRAGLLRGLKGFDDPAAWDVQYPRGIQIPIPEFDRPPLDRPLLNGIPRPLPPALAKFPAFFDWGPIDVEPEATIDGRIADWAAVEVSRKHEKPFFVAAGFYRPHTPLYVPREFYDRYPAEKVQLPERREDDLDDVPPAGRRVAQIETWRAIEELDKRRDLVRTYLACIEFVDAQLGRLLDALDESGQANNTIVVLWSDHGWHLGEKGQYQKQTLWEEATRVPFIIVAPGVAAPGGRCDEPVSLLDVYPTLLALTGLSTPQALDGENLVPQLREPQRATGRKVVISLKPDMHAVRSKTHRYIRYAGPGAGEELYDHRADPNEWMNLADDPAHAEVKRDLARALE